MSVWSILELICELLGVGRPTFGAARSSGWRSVRREHLAANPACAACGTREKLEVHHVKPFHLYPELELDGRNLITLCGKGCHFTFGHLRDWSSYNSAVVEDSSVYLSRVVSRPRRGKPAG